MNWEDHIIIVYVNHIVVTSDDLYECLAYKLTWLEND